MGGSETEKVTFARLPTHVVPTKYYLDYDVIDLMNYRFEASERVELLIKEDTKEITCHAVELYVFDVSVAYSTAETTEPHRVNAASIRYLASQESIAIELEEVIPAQACNVVLHLRFHGFLNDKMKGFYRSEYDHQNERRTLAVTQFEACDARRAFVCWDEPAIKAKYEISMVTEPQLIALSNMHVVQTQLRPKRNAHLREQTRADDRMEKWWKFAETPIMSTYLVAMVVGEFDLVSDVSADGVLVNVYTPPGKSERGRFALDVGVKALGFFTDRFGIAYPLKKLDMIAIPDFLGAMENWGLVTYMESFLLFDEQLSSHEQRMETARTVCHEISHQWFGNLVTMDWWTGLWLNEGFAHFMEFDAVDYIFPEWNVWDLFVQEAMMGIALAKDCMLSSHPIEVEVHHPDEVDEIFDAISYDKGASIIRMLSEYLGRDVFYKGVHNYLVKYSYQNTKTQDLWEALEDVSGQRLTEMANSWTKQTGYPLVTVLKQADGSYAISQERFFADISLRNGDNTSWDIPLTLVSSSSPNEVKRIGIWSGKSGTDGGGEVPLVASADINSHIIVSSDSHGWLKLNHKQAGYYLVNYPSELWKKLQLPVKSKIFSVVDRIGLLNSVYALTGAGVLPISQALDFTNAFVDETEHLCWKEISTRLGGYCAMFRDEPFYPRLQHYIRNLYTGIMSKLGWEKKSSHEGSDMGQFRKDVILMLGLANDVATIKEANNRFARHVGGDSSALCGDIRAAVFRIHAWHGNEENHVQEMKKLYESSDFSEEKEDCLITIGMIPCPKLKLHVLEWASANVRLGDISRVFLGVSSDKVGREVAWKYIQDHWEDLTSKHSGMNMGRIVGVVLQQFQSEATAIEIEEFMKGRNTSAFERKLQDALEKIRLKSTRFHRDRDALAEWLQTFD